MQMLLEGALLAVIVVWLFLRDWRATWISALALPLSVLPTFGVMHFFGFSLNLLSLLALAVVVGVLVDDAIVEVENIARHRAMGKSPMQAAIDAADEIGVAVIATSRDAGGGVRAGRLHAGHHRQVLPRVRLDRRHRGAVLAAGGAPADADARRLLHEGRAKSAADSPLMPRYLGWVHYALEHRRRTLGLAMLTFVGSLALVPLIPNDLPAAVRPVAGTALARPAAGRASRRHARGRARGARAAARDDPEVAQVFATVGGDAGRLAAVAS